MAHFVSAKKSFTAADTRHRGASRRPSYPLPRISTGTHIGPRPPLPVEPLATTMSPLVKRAMSSSYHPQSDGQTERVNRTLEQMLRTYIQSDEREWERLLPALEFAYNMTSHSSTELFPFEVMVGENALTAANLDIVGALAPTLTPPMTKLFRQL
ncbi:LOW QUALITY PROTEIN: hypothetical protein ENH_00004720 [Eimeria necatrix]|uniref:Integrase catalytic domain-containing protein n=1 Tax=Eimeria necatrix TaxID=51315 RepID=U6MUR1_9EIME|nr:LOW QUALITY PROTEIN: hypothetical protein ENH_00004720 [Eimeria necatrix]CDJ65420.1 hypothetical protein ENH_00004720 [Eimeria necatrix]